MPAGIFHEMKDKKDLHLPSVTQIRLAIDLFCRQAYPKGTPAHVADKFAVADDCDIAQWLMSDVAERDPADVPVSQVRSFALRIGNESYPNMKLRLTRPGKQDVLLFSVDAHDEFLLAPPGSPDYEALEELKKVNSAIVSAVETAWAGEGIATEKTHLRHAIEDARKRNTGG